jgi:hypothetical protein
MKAQKPFFTPLKEVVDIILDYFNVTLIGNIPVTSNQGKSNSWDNQEII